MFLEAEAAFPYCNLSIKMAWIIWFGSTSVAIGPAYVKKKYWLSSFLKLCKCKNFLKTKKIFFCYHQKEKYLPEKIETKILSVWFASVLAPSSAVFGFPYTLHD